MLAHGEMTVGGNSNVPPAPQVDRSKCSDKGKEIVTADTNQDKKPDVWKFFQTVNVNGQKVQVLTCKQVDLNHDGKLDLVYYYDDKGAQTTLEEFDMDLDGKFDMTVYYANGKKVREELDTNFDQKADIFKYYEEEKLVRIERDTNNDGRIDEWQYFEAGNARRLAEAIEVLYRQPGRRRALASRASQVARILSWDRERENFFDAIDSILPASALNRRVSALSARSSLQLEQEKIVRNN